MASVLLGQQSKRVNQLSFGGERWPLRRFVSACGCGAALAAIERTVGFERPPLFELFLLLLLLL